MKVLIVAFAILISAVAIAQTTLPFRNKDGEVIGTATTWSNVVYIRDLNGELLATITFEGDQMILRDPSGKVLDTATWLKTK